MSDLTSSGSSRIATREDGRVPTSRDAESQRNRGQADISDADRRHRLEFERYASDDGHEHYREILRRIYAAWNDWNRTHFDGKLVPPHLLLSEPKNPQALGDHSLLSGWGSTNQTRIRPSILDGTHPQTRPCDQFREGRIRLVLDIALHETIHQYATEILDRAEIPYRGHGPVFRDICNEIGVRLGLPLVRIAKARGRDRDRPSCAQWPICVRPRDYYLGAYLPHEEPVEGGDAEARSIPKAPKAPKALADWIAENPEWAEQYGRFGEAIFELFDRFFDAHPAPPLVQEQAVIFLAKIYRHRRCHREQSTSIPALPDWTSES